MENKETKKKRMIALIGSGIFVVIILPLIGIIIALLIDDLLRLPRLLIFPVNLIVAIPIIAWGFFWSLWSNYELYKVGEGSPIPRKDIHTIKVVTSGPYKYCRNPMIFGYIFLWIGLGVLINSLFLTFGISSIVTLLLVIMVKLWEEKHLKNLFGEEYEKYREKVPFLIPRKKKSFASSKL